MMRPGNVVAKRLAVAAFQMEQPAAAETFQMKMMAVTAAGVFGIGINEAAPLAVTQAAELPFLAQLAHKAVYGALSHRDPLAHQRRRQLLDGQLPPGMLGKISQKPLPSDRMISGLFHVDSLSFILILIHKNENDGYFITFILNCQQKIENTFS